MGDSLVGWCRANGAFVTEKVDFCYDFDGTGYRGVVALEDISEGEMLLRIPRELLLRPADSESISNKAETAIPACPVRKLFANGDLKASPLIQVALAAMHHNVHGSKPADSFWSPYISPLLPQNMGFDTPLFWSSNELEALRGTSLHMRMLQEGKEQQKEHNKQNGKGHTHSAGWSGKSQCNQDQPLQFGAMMKTMFGGNILPLMAARYSGTVPHAYKLTTTTHHHTTHTG
jgi:hypothetical protein